MTEHVHRIDVVWPTPDGRPWPRVVANPHSSHPAYNAPRLGEDATLAWLVPLLDAGVLDEFELDRDLGGEVVGWLLPLTGRRHYLSGRAALEWRRRASLLGARVTVTTSEPVRFPDPAPATAPDTAPAG